MLGFIAASHTEDHPSNRKFEPGIRPSRERRNESKRHNELYKRQSIKTGALSLIQWNLDTTKCQVTGKICLP